MQQGGQIQEASGHADELDMSLGKDKGDLNSVPNFSVLGPWRFCLQRRGAMEVRSGEMVNVWAVRYYLLEVQGKAVIYRQSPTQERGQGCS